MIFLVHSPLLQQSLLLSLPPLIDMLKFGGSLHVHQVSETSQKREGFSTVLLHAVLLLSSRSLCGCGATVSLLRTYHLAAEGLVVWGCCHTGRDERSASKHSPGGQRVPPLMNEPFDLQLTLSSGPDGPILGSHSAFTPPSFDIALDRLPWSQGRRGESTHTSMLLRTVFDRTSQSRGDTRQWDNAARDTGAPAAPRKGEGGCVAVLALCPGWRTHRRERSHR